MRAFAVLSILFYLTACVDSTMLEPINQHTDGNRDISAEISAPVFGSWGVDLKSRDISIHPGDDFFHYANGKWLAEHAIPADRSSYGVSLILHENAQQRVRAIIEELVKNSGKKGSPEQKVGDYYASWMNTETLNKLGMMPLKPDLDRIATIKTISELTAEFGRVHYRVWSGSL